MLCPPVADDAVVQNSQLPLGWADGPEQLANPQTPVSPPLQLMKKVRKPACDTSKALCQTQVRLGAC